MGKREAARNRRTLFYMPHCDKVLYQNVLLSNRIALSQEPQSLFILGNSFSSYHQRYGTPIASTHIPSYLLTYPLSLPPDPNTRCVTQQQRSEAAVLLHVLPTTSETPLPVCDLQPEAFNDTSLHSFTGATGVDLEQFSEHLENIPCC
jgi:hypothetical protein